MAAESSNSEAASSSVDPNNMEWLIEIMEDQRERMESQGPKKSGNTKHWIPLADTLRKSHSDEYFEPSVVSFGPYHHGEEKTMEMEPQKKVAVTWFISLQKGTPANEVTDEAAIDVYKKFKEQVGSVPHAEWYDVKHKYFETFETEGLMRMLFRDGCFILLFIHLVLEGSSDEYISKSSYDFNHSLIVRDMFLLENQIPFPILRALISLLPEKKKADDLIIKFIFTVFLPQYELIFSQMGLLRVMFWIFKLFMLPVWTLIFSSHWKCLFGGDGETALHLLHILRAVLMGESASPDSTSGSGGYWYYYFRPIRELKAAGIQVRRSNALTLKHIKLTRGLLHSYLEIPPIIVDDATKTRLLNLAAYEMSPHGPKGRTVTSYICFLDSLIDHAEDVNELQSENILLNRFGNSEAVSKLFKELATALSPDSNVYAHVIHGIEGHNKRHLNPERVQLGKWIHQFKRTYFTSPWTLISLIGGVLVVVLTLLQTIYALLAFYKTF